jgi:hypothetical protein
LATRPATIAGDSPRGIAAFVDEVFDAEAAKICAFVQFQDAIEHCADGATLVLVDRFFSGGFYDLLVIASSARPQT